jgi:hypothetical protein
MPPPSRRRSPIDNPPGKEPDAEVETAPGEEEEPPPAAVGTMEESVGEGSGTTLGSLAIGLR